MKLYFKSIFIGYFILFQTGCAMLQNQSQSHKLKLRPYFRETLENGLEVIWIKDETLPRVSLQLMMRAGSIFETDEEAGLNSMMMSMLNESTKKRSVQELADYSEYYAIDYGASGGSESSRMSMTALVTQRDKMLPIFEEVLLQPAFAAKDLERRKANIIAGYKRLFDDPSTVADIEFNKLLYPQHPFGRLIMGEPQSINQLTEADLLRFYQLYVRPQRSILVVGGHWDDNFKEQVKVTFNKWKKWDNVDKKTASPLLPPAQTVTKTKKDLEQSQIRLGHLSVARKHPDFIKLRLANMVLGGAFASRLNQKIRDDLGLTYSISSSLDVNRDIGSFEISTFTKPDQVTTMITEIKKLLEQFVSQGITQQELDGAKSVSIGQFPSAIETTDRMGSLLANLWLLDVNDDYLKNYQSIIEQVTLVEVNQAIKEHIHPDKLQVLIYTKGK